MASLPLYRSHLNYRPRHPLDSALTHTVYGIRPAGNLRFPNFAPGEIVAGKNLPEQILAALAARRVQYTDVLHPIHPLDEFLLPAHPIELLAFVSQSLFLLFLLNNLGHNPGADGAATFTNSKP